MESETNEPTITGHDLLTSSETTPEVIEIPEAIFATFDDDGFPTGFYSTIIVGDEYPDGAVEITQEQWSEFVNNSGRRIWVDGEVVEYSPPAAPDPITIVNKLDLWSRMTDEEADQVGAAIDTQPIRTRKIFETANSYRSDHELWPLLQQLATSLFGAERAAEILAPSV